MTFRPSRTAVAFGLALAATLASAQAVYRIVGPDGRVTFTDRPPTDAASAPTRASATGASGVALPFELAQVASRYPVTLYSGPQCAACDAGRQYLTTRGIPFAERTVSTPDDIAALQRLAGEAALPLLTIGGQQVRGYSDVEWGQFLDAAGYPARSQLPPGYRRAAATPLVTAERPTAPAAPAASAASAAPGATGDPPVQAVPTRPRAAPQRTPADNSNPAGIRF